MRKLEIKLAIENEKTKSKALKMLAVVKGVYSVAVDMRENKFTVVGDADPIHVIAQLRKLGYAELIAVGPAKEEGPEPTLQTLQLCLYETCFRYRNSEYFQLNSLQCKHLCDALSAILSEIRYVDPSIRKETSRRMKEAAEHSSFPKDSKQLQTDQILSYPNALREIYRAVKEAVMYLHHCSSDEWPIQFLTRLTTGEAYSLHLHDLALSRLLLDVILITDTSEICTKIFHFYKEMGRFMKIRYDYADEIQLIKTCERFAERSIHTTEERNIVEVSKFLGEKLKGTVQIPASTEVESSAGADNPIPTWLQIDPADLVLKSENGAIGEGSFGHVYEGLWLGVRVAAKEMPRDARDVFESEASILAKLHSPLIVQLIGTCIKDSHLYLVMELVSSNLEQLLQDRSKGGRPPFSLPVAVDIMLQISRAMEYLHSQEIMHLDLKASNVLFELSSVPESRKEGYGQVKLCDFGTASPRLFSFRASDPKGTCYWRAPEVFPLPYEDVSAETTTPEKYTSKADVYSFAMTCYEIITGKQPFAGVLPRELHTRIVNEERPTLEPSICPFILANYIQQCWHTDPGHRPCFEAVSDFLRRLKILILKTRLHWNQALDSKFYSDFGLDSRY